MTLPDNKALIEEARSIHILSGAKEHVFNVASRLADALEASEAEKVRLKNGIALEQEELVKAVEGQESLRKEIAERDRQLQQTQARLEIVHQWAEMNPYSGVHDAPLEVRQALAYRGTGAVHILAAIEGLMDSAGAERRRGTELKLMQEHWVIGEDGDVDVFLFPNDKGGTVNAYLGIYQGNKFLGSIEGAELRRLVKAVQPYADARNEDEAGAEKEGG